jgi:hypothetical protein
MHTHTVCTTSQATSRARQPQDSSLFLSRQGARPRSVLYAVTTHAPLRHHHASKRTQTHGSEGVQLPQQPLQVTGNTCQGGGNQHTRGRGGAAASTASSCHRKYMQKERQPAHPDRGAKGVQLQWGGRTTLKWATGARVPWGTAAYSTGTTTLQLAAMQSRRWPPLGPHTLLRPPAAATCHFSDLL